MSCINECDEDRIIANIGFWDKYKLVKTIDDLILKYLYIYIYIYVYVSEYVCNTYVYEQYE